MSLKTFIFIITLLAKFEFLLHVVLFIFYIYQFMFGDYIEELWGKLGLDMGDEDEDGNFITDKFEELFNEYHSELYGLGYFLLMFMGFILLVMNFISMIIFVIPYWCHLKRKGCCTCKKVWSYISLILSAILTIPYIVHAISAKSKIDLPDYQIYQFDEAFNKKTKDNINFMKIRRIILIAGAAILYLSYIIHLVLLVCFNKLIVIEITGKVISTAPNNNDEQDNNNIMVNQVQILNSNENCIQENNK